MGYNSILDRLVEKYPNAEGINDARNIAEAVAAINGVGGRGAGAIADQFFAKEDSGGGERILIYEGTIQSTGQGMYDGSFTPLTSDVIRDTLHVTYDGVEYEIPRTEFGATYGEIGNTPAGTGYVFTTYPVAITFNSATSGEILIGDAAEQDHQIKIEAEGTGGPIVVDLKVPELADRTSLTSGPSPDMVFALMPSPDPAFYTVRLVVGDEDIYTPPDYYYASGDMAGQYLDVNFTVDGEPWCVVLNTREAQGAHRLRSGHFGTDPNS